MSTSESEMGFANVESANSVASLLNSIHSAVIIDDIEDVNRYFADLRDCGVKSFLTAWHDDAQVLENVLDRIETLWLNPLSIQLFEVESEEALREILPQAYIVDPHPFVDFLEAMFQGETSFQTEYKQPLPSGNTAHLCVTSHITTIADRLVSICTFTDTKWYSDQTNLSEQQRLYGKALEGTQFGAWQLDLRRGEYAVDREYGTLMGLEPLHRNLTVAQMQQFIHPDDRQLAAKFPTTEKIDREFRIRRPNGRLILVNEMGSVTDWDAHGVPIAAAGTIRDVTQAIQRQKLHDVEKLILESSMAGAEESEVLQALASGVDDAILNHGCIAVLFGDELKIRASVPADAERSQDSVSPLENRNREHASFERLLSQLPSRFSDCVDTKGCDYIPDIMGSDANDPTAVELRGYGVHSVGALPILTSDNHAIGAICLTSSSANDSQPDGLADLMRLSRVVALVIQERRQANVQRLLDQQTQNRHRFASLGRLAGGIAHDFNNLLTTIMSNAQLCEIQRDDPEGVANSASRILQASEVAASLCRQMLTYAGQVEATVKSIDVVEIAERIVALIRPSISSRVQLDLCSESDVPKILGNDGAISQVVMNLLINAFEAIDDDGKIQVRLGVKKLDEAATAKYVFGSRLRGGQYVCLCVSDSGCGLSDEARLHLFDPFFSTKESGRGLGLSTVIGIVENHGAAIVVDSTLGEGTRIEIVFPLLSKPSRSEDKATDWKPVDVKHRVLVVDDRNDVRTAIRSLLESQGIKVAGVASGEEALQQIESQSFDLIFLDQQMHGISGLETYRRLRAANNQTPVCFMTGFAATSELEAVNRLDDKTSLIRKPLGRKQLEAAFQKHAPKGAIMRADTADG